MASQVLSGTSNPSYTNNTGQNVRIVINYMSSTTNNDLSVSWAGVGVGGRYTTPTVIGRNLAFNTLVQRSATGGISAQTQQSVTLPTSQSPAITTLTTVPVAANVDVEISLAASNNSGAGGGALPTELMLAPGQIFSAVCGAYNIVVIPELG